MSPHAQGGVSVGRERPPAWRVATNLGKSFQYAGAGLLYATATQRNFRIHLGIGAVALGLAWFLHLSFVETALIGLTCGLVMAMELLNTALEAVVDLAAGKEFHVLAQIAKDCAAAAVLVSALTALGVAGCLLLPPLWEMVHGWVKLA
ncbi:MAG: diacylglycerol kinase [Cyanobacteriota bacterium]|nr:diacylglycerol kinase [Cyanobacteriota bacterium]